LKKLGTLETIERTLEKKKKVGKMKRRGVRPSKFCGVDQNKKRNGKKNGSLPFLPRKSEILEEYHFLIFREGRKELVKKKRAVENLCVRGSEGVNREVGGPEEK